MRVSEICFKIKNILHADLGLRDIWVEGELSEVKDYSGSYYFRLKEGDYVLDCFMSYQNTFHAKNVEWSNGKKIKAYGYISTVDKRSSYRLIVTKAEPDQGLGEKFLELERLKEKLRAEGLFNPEHKKKIPIFPQRIGIVTSIRGAVLKDILRNLRMRFPIVSVYIFDSLVQGDEAPLQLIRALKEADKPEYQLDMIIIARGGGSTEDLWCFNDEQLVRTIYHLRLPIISGVGHETDTTLCDYVADARAATPTEAVIQATPELVTIIQDLDEKHSFLTRFMTQFIERQQEVLINLEKEVNYVMKNTLMARQHELDTFQLEMSKLWERNLNSSNNELDSMHRQLMDLLQSNVFVESQFLELLVTECSQAFSTFLNNQMEQLTRSEQTLIQSISQHLSEQKLWLSQAEASLKPYDHDGILSQGYSITLHEGKLLQSIQEIKAGEMVKTIVKDGIFVSEIKSIE